MKKLFISMENINKKLEKLDTLEQELKEMNSKILKKEDVEKIIQDQLINVKTALMSQEVKLKRQENEITNMDKRFEKRLSELEKKVDENNDQTEGLKKKEVKEMIARATNDRSGEKELDRDRPNRNIIVHGVEEGQRAEELKKIQDVAYEIGLNLHRWDVDKTTRLGAFEKGKKRPLKVELVSETTKMDILKNKKKLKSSELYSDIQVVPDETKEMRHAKAILRQAAYLAKRNGEKVWQRHDLIWVNGVKYTVDNVDDIPNEFRFQRKKEEVTKDRHQEKKKKDEDAETRGDGDKELEMDVTMPQEIGSAQFKNKNWDQAARAAYVAPKDLELEGAMQLTKRGLAFFTGRSYLSNFFKITIKFNGKVFQSSEQAYQYEKASVCRDSVRMERIYKVKTPKEAKDIGG